MFDPSPNPRLFAVPLGVDFPVALVDGLVSRFKDRPPEALARVTLIVNTRRMARRIRQIFDDGPPRLLPRILLLSDLDSWVQGPVPDTIPPLRRRLELAQLVDRLIQAEPDLAPRSSIYDLADSLAGLIDEMQGENVPPNKLRDLDVSDMSGHWQRALQFISIAEQLVQPDDGQSLDPEARQRWVVDRLIQEWHTNPRTEPVILAGSTGSRGTTLALMRAIACLPQGAVVVPGFDFDQPDAVWATMSDPHATEDHPQYRYHKLMTELDLAPRDVMPWSRITPASPARNAAWSLALRPAPVTDAWMREGPELAQLDSAFSQVTLVEAPDPRSEALAIALRLRQAVEDGERAALITPDRMLTRQVTAALDRWRLVPDDSAGTPLHLSAPGRFLRQIAGLFQANLDGQTLLALLKHPLSHSAAAAMCTCC